MKDEEVNEKLSPGVVKLRGNDNGHEVIDISSGSSENEDVIVNDGVVDVGRQAGPGRGHRPVIICRRPARLHHPVQVFSFEKVISKSQAKGGHTLPIPRKIVENFIRGYWRDLNLEVRGTCRNYCCKLLWRPGSDKDKDFHLGKRWYNLVTEMDLKKGDRMVFKSIIVGLNVMSVTIHRKGS
ncbi:DNA-binding barrel domain superfamily [Sesbania bispinosa]|nr:DNA-binding barrel domain superfamily [Sesbania bispinosa]